MVVAGVTVSMPCGNKRGVVVEVVVVGPPVVGVATVVGDEVPVVSNTSTCSTN